MPHVNFKNWTPCDYACLGFVRRGDELLLIHKLRGLGAGKVNGFGGKLEPGENATQALLREAREEIGIEVVDPEARARLFFHFVDGYRIEVVVFMIDQYRHNPVESPEAVPFWCKIQQLPLDQMWEDDRLWLPSLLDGKRFRGFFSFDGDRMLSQLIEWDDNYDPHPELGHDSALVR